MIKYLILLSLILSLVGCNTQTAAPVPTLTLVPLVTLTPRFTATPVASRTPLPTFTYTPSITPIPPTPSNTYTPTEIPPVIGIISSLQTVNMREGPGGSYSALVALNPGTGVEVLGRNPEGTWLNVKLDDGTEGWIFAELVRIEATPTPFPSTTASPDMTAILSGTIQPTALFGGGSVTATPPRSAVTATPPGTEEVSAFTPFPAGATATANLPVINLTAINETATALSAGLDTPVPGAATATTNFQLVTPTLAFTGAAPTLQLSQVSPTQATQVGGPSTPAPTSASGDASVQENVGILAYCDNPIHGRPAPTNLSAGSTITVYWAWFAKTREQVEDHLDAATYEVRLNGNLLQNWRLYQTNIRQERNNDYYVYWYFPAGAVNTGVNTINYRVTWSRQISDGYNVFGPGTNTLSEEGTCTFTVR